ncbi:hypothetical protein ACWCPT_05860 [Streptomyces sp. NPDC002308]
MTLLHLAPGLALLAASLVLLGLLAGEERRARRAAHNSPKGQSR